MMLNVLSNIDVNPLYSDGSFHQKIIEIITIRMRLSIFQLMHISAIIANSAGPDEVSCLGTFNLDLHC